MLQLVSASRWSKDLSLACVFILHTMLWLCNDSPEATEVLKLRKKIRFRLACSTKSRRFGAYLWSATLKLLMIGPEANLGIRIMIDCVNAPT